MLEENASINQIGIFRVIELINNKDKWKKLPSTIITWLESQKNNSILPPQNGMLIESFPKI